MGKNVRKTTNNHRRILMKNTTVKIIKKENGLTRKIEKNIPITNSRYALNPFHELFSSMKTGDSFQMTKEEYGRIHYYASAFGKKNDCAFVFRTTDNGKRC